jgi:hypothetical protein
MLMPGRVPKLWLQLRRANKKNLQTFIDVRISFAWRWFTLHILRHMDRLRYEKLLVRKLSQTNTKPFPSSMQLSKTVSLNQIRNSST